MILKTKHNTKYKIFLKSLASLNLVTLGDTQLPSLLPRTIHYRKVKLHHREPQCNNFPPRKILSISKHYQDRNTHFRQSTPNRMYDEFRRKTSLKCRQSSLHNISNGLGNAVETHKRITKMQLTPWDKHNLRFFLIPYGDTLAHSCINCKQV